MQKLKQQQRGLSIEGLYVGRNMRLIGSRSFHTMAAPRPEARASKASSFCKRRVGVDLLLR